MSSHAPLAILHSLGITQKKLGNIPYERSHDFLVNVDMQKLLQIGLNPEQATKVLDKNTTQTVEHVESTLQSLQIEIIHRDDDGFPQLLKELPDCPTILYVRGKLPAHEALISVVGSRKHSQYAVSCLEKIIPDLVRSGYGVVSGGAYGIDSVAHEVTLKNNGHTIAVFGAGVDVYYPPSSHRLFDEIIAKGGALISQFPLGTPSEPFNFPIRNAVVAGISRGTLIAEAGEDSGTLITARLALEANREVFVIPADITREGALGSNALIRDGLGKLITSANDILSEYQIVDKQTSLLSLKPSFTDPVQESLYEILCRDSLGIDTLAEKLSADTSTIMMALSMMEIEGIIQSQGGIYRIA